MSKIVLITGCSSGIGEATARLLNKQGFRVYATARKIDALKSLADEGCQTLSLDVTSDQSMKAAVDTIIAREGRIDILVNNAGFSQSGALETLEIERVRAQFETNVFGLLRLTQLVLPHMRAQKSGRIINISSIGGKMTFAGGGAYHATKHALEALSDAMRVEVAPFGIEVVVIQPGLIKTEFANTVTREMPISPIDDPYAKFNASVAKGTQDAYEKGPMALLAGTGQSTARVIARAITAPSPKTRYRVSASAELLFFVRGLLSDRGWDGFVRSRFG